MREVTRRRKHTRTPLSNRSSYLYKGASSGSADAPRITLLFVLGWWCGVPTSSDVGLGWAASIRYLVPKFSLSPAKALDGKARRGEKKKKETWQADGRYHQPPCFLT